MAEHAIYIVPAKSDFLPSKEVQEKALEFFREVSPLPNANGDYYWRSYKDPVLVDSGEALERVICPCCGESTDIYDHDEWWDEAQETIYQDIKCTIEMPCCGESAKILDLKFDALSVFARFSIGALEPSTSDYWEDERTLKATTLAKFEEIIGCPVLVIWSVQ
jgi:hypothetical protein